MKTFSAIAFERDERIAKDLVDQSVHGGFFEFASIARFAAEFCRAFDFFRQKI